MKSALVDFLINAGIKLTSIASYNHLGNNDGKNLSSQKQFRSKEISKSNVVDDMVAAKADGLVTTHEDLGVVLIKSTLVVTNSRHVLDDDSVVASPLIIDLVVLAEMMTRISWQSDSDGDEYKGFRLRLEADAGTEDVDKSGALLAQGVDDWGGLYLPR
jgi:myo-inositol-1-phosphate synthase